MPFPFVRTSSALLAFPLILAACGSDGGPVGENANATPASGDPTVAALAPGEAQPVQFEASDGVTVHGAWYPAKEPAATILLFHQAGANKAEYATIAPMLAKAGYNALAIDQRSGGDMFGGTNETVAGIGGSAPDYEAALAVLFVSALLTAGGKHVVTANKALLAFHGEKLFAASEKSSANLYYEASVAGGIPIIKLLREGLIGNRVTELYGILNGTCNFILTQMQENGMGFDEAVTEAQVQGFAEADPSMDVDGHDAAHKVGILASLAHGFWVKPKRVFTEGIRHVTPQDLAFADQLGYRIKLLGTVKAAKDAPVQVTMYPALVPKSHVLASVGGVYNAIYLKGDVLGDTLYYGQGAGQDATASAVLGDIDCPATPRSNKGQGGSS